MAAIRSLCRSKIRARGSAAPVRWFPVLLAAVLLCGWGPFSLRAQSVPESPAAESPAVETPANEESARTEPEPDDGANGPGLDADKASGGLAGQGLVRLSKEHPLWIDLKRKIVVVDGEVCLREGQLEMFACPKGSKEHESIVAVNCKAQFIHAALLAIGAEPGRAVRFDPEYVPAAGTEIEVLVLWKDREGNNRTVPAQHWIRHVRTGKAMTYPWVFAGSGFWTDEQSGERYYHADAGDLICVSNFPTAMLDLPVESSQQNTDLLFEAFTERIPARGTQVRLVLRPKPKSNSKKSEGRGTPDPSSKPERPAKSDS